MEFIPIIGPLVAAIAILGVGFLANYSHLVLLAILLGGWRVMQDYFNSPRIMGSKLKMHPLAAIFAVLVGGEIAGVIGVYLSIPIMAALRILWKRWSAYSEPTSASASVIAARGESRGMTYCNKIQWQYSLAFCSILVSHCPQRSRSALRNMSYPSDLPRSSASKKLDKVGKRSKTAGFYSKGLILWETWASPKGSTALWLAGVFGVLLTSLYIFRVIFLVFFGDAKARVLRPPDTRSKFRWWFSPFSRW